jgi:plastocyanin
MRVTSSSWITGCAVLVFIGAVAGLACGETGDTDPTPVRTFLITPAANASPNASTVPSSPTPPAPATPDASPTPGGSGGQTTIVIAGISSEFDVEEVEAEAGSITIEFDNRDSGIVHNIHFYRGNDSDGESVAESELEVGPVKQTLTFDVEPGEYYYVCDAHPATMEGILTVE